MTTQFSLPDIPEKRYFTIGEAGDLCQVKPHVLRYWEQEFSQLKPVKRRGNRRYYQRKDIELVRQIRDLLYGNGYTINGAKKALINQRATAAQTPVASATTVESAVPQASSTSPAASHNALLDEVRAELEVLLVDLHAV